MLQEPLHLFSVHTGATLPVSSRQFEAFIPQRGAMCSLGSENPCSEPSPSPNQLLPTLRPSEVYPLETLTGYAVNAEKSTTRSTRYVREARLHSMNFVMKRRVLE